MVSSPKAPNPYQQAAADQQAQTGAAYASSIINNPNEQSPYGAVQYQVAGWEQVPGADGRMINVPRYTRTTTLSPDEQRIAGYDTGTRANLGRTAVQQSAKIGDYLNTSINPSGWNPWQKGTAFSEATDRPTIEKAMLARYRDTAAKQNAAQDVQLSLRGMSPGSQGYADKEQSRNQADVDAQNQAYLASGQEARSNYEEAMNYWNFANSLRQAQAQETFALRNQPINEIMALLGGAQVNMPQFSPFSRQGIGAASPGSYVASNYQNQMAQTASTNQALAGLAGAGLGAVGMGIGRGGIWA